MLGSNLWAQVTPALEAGTMGTGHHAGFEFCTLCFVSFGPYFIVEIINMWTSRKSCIFLRYITDYLPADNLILNIK